MDSGLRRNGREGLKPSPTETRYGISLTLFAVFNEIPDVLLFHTVVKRDPIRIRSKVHIHFIQCYSLRLRPSEVFRLRSQLSQERQ
jgi:hypothetical protein